MKAITLTAYKRPQYLKSMLDSLDINDPKTRGYQLMFGIEPGNQEVIDLCRGVRFTDTNVIVNPAVLGVRNNPFILLDRAFRAGNELVVYLEDDIVLSADCLALCDWYEQLPSKNDYLCLNLYNHESIEEPVAVQKAKSFSSLGFAITQYQWETYFKKAWYANKSGWDFGPTSLLNDRPELFNLRPALSRTHHIGLDGGTHYRRKDHDHIYLNNKWNQGPVITEFELKD